MQVEEMEMDFFFLLHFFPYVKTTMWWQRKL